MPSERSPAIDISSSARLVDALPNLGSRLRPTAVTVIALAVFVASVTFYGICLYPGLGGEINPGDSAKFQVLGHTPIMVHGPGYPLILMIGSVVRWLSLPLPAWWTMAFAISAVPAAIANAFGFLIVRRLTDSTLFALGGALILGTASLMTLQATEAEVYAINIAFVLATTYLLLLFIETKRLAFFLGACAVYALSFGNHLMMISMVPVFIAVAVTHSRIVLHWRVVGLVLLLILVGASQYGYLAYVAYDPRTSYSEYMPLPPAPVELLRYILVFYFGDLFGTGLESSRQVEVLARTLWTAHPWVSAPLIAAGLLLFVLGGRRRDQSWWGIALTFGTALSFVPFVLWFGAGDIRAFHLPVLAPALLAAVASLACGLGQWPQLRGGIALFLVLFGVLRTGETAVALTSRESPLDAVKPQIWELMLSHPHPERPFVALTYPLRMASLYYELAGELPSPVTYRMQWRMMYEVPYLTSVGGFVVGREGEGFIRMIEHEHPGMVCRTESAPLRQHYRWPVSSFQCEVPPGTAGPP